MEVTRVPDAPTAAHRVVLGFRPEDLEDATLTAGAPAQNTLSAVTDIREDMGPEVYVHFSLGVAPVRTPDVSEAMRAEDEETEPEPGVLRRRAPFVARVGRETAAREGEAIHLVVDTNRLYLFDPESSEAIS